MNTDQILDQITIAKQRLPFHNDHHICGAQRGTLYIQAYPETEIRIPLSTIFFTPEKTVSPKILSDL